MTKIFTDLPVTEPNKAKRRTVFNLKERKDTEEEEIKEELQTKRARPTR
jgi:hypothetical protein